jgi:hypothetical protein
MKDMKNAILVIALITIAGCAASQASKVSFASGINYGDYFSSLPTINVESPKNNTAYSEIMRINFTISFTMGGTYGWTFYELYVWTLSYKIDNGTSVDFPAYNIVNGTNRLSATQGFRLNIANLTSGQHQIEITARFFWYSPDYADDFYYPFEPIVFYVNNLALNNTKSEQTSTPIIIPTQSLKPSLSLSPSSYPTQQPTAILSPLPSTNGHGPPPSFTILHLFVVIIILAIITAIGAVVYSKRRRR